MRRIIFCALLTGAGITASAQTGNQPYGKNIVAFAPVQATTNTATGFGLHMEHFIGPAQKFSVYLPLAYSFGHPDPCFDGVTSKMLYAFPGVKWYPGGSNRPVSYSLGLSAGIGAGKMHQSYFDVECPAGLTEDQIKNGFDYRQFQAGWVINNGLNITIGQHYYAGAELGIGWMYINQNAYYENRQDLMIQGNVKFGYRF